MPAISPGEASQQQDVDGGYARRPRPVQGAELGMWAVLSSAIAVIDGSHPARSGARTERSGGGAFTEGAMKWDARSDGGQLL